MDSAIATADAEPLAVNRRRFDVAEFYRMAETGILNEDDRIELIDGELIEMHPIGGRHIWAILVLTRCLSAAAAGEQMWVSVQNPARLDDKNEPQPDIALLRPLPGKLGDGSPPRADDVLLLVEVAHSSLRYDQRVKLPLYARHGIPEVWIVDLDGRAVEICTGPNADGYTSITRAADTDVIAPTALPAARIVVAELMGTGE